MNDMAMREEKGKGKRGMGSVDFSYGLFLLPSLQTETASPPFLTSCVAFSLIPAII